MLLLWSVLLFLTGGLAVFLFLAQDLPFAEEYHRYNRVRKDAAALGHVVVYSRHHVRHDGSLRSVQPRPAWKTLVEPAAPPAAEALRVVFVHGFDVGLTQSIAEGNHLARLLRQWTEQKGAGPALEFHTFSWRSDFGPAEHLRALKAAAAQSGALAEYLARLAQPPAGGGPAPRVVVITHGLGALLALEALQKTGEGAPPLEALVMVQPAVRRIDLSRGTYEVVTGDAVSNVDYTGQYFGVLGRARLALATCSSTDTEVAQFFAPEPELSDEIPRSPKSTVALGTPYYSSTEAEVFPPNFRLIDLSPGRYLDMVMPAHGSLFDGGGRRAFWSLWQRVLRQAEGS